MYINFVLLIFSIVFSVTARANPQDQLSHALTSFEQAKYAIALEQLEKLSRNNSDPDINFYLARSLFKDRQFKKAREILENNIKHHPGHADSHYLLGTVKLSLIREVSIFKKPGMAKSALSAWQAAVAADEKHVESRYAVASYLMNAPGLVGGNRNRSTANIGEAEPTLFSSRQCHS